MARGGAYDYRKHLLRQLRLFVWPEGRAEMNALVYRGPADFVLQHGEWFEPAQVPDEYQALIGQPGKCYANSIIGAVVGGLEYIEGWAVDPGGSGFIIHHSWNVDEDGVLVDLTWSGIRALAFEGLASLPSVIVGKPGLAYLGVRFSVERADDCSWNGEASVLDDSTRRWPLLRSRWEGEPNDVVWPPSDRLEALRARRRGDREAARLAFARMVAEAASGTA